MGPEGGSPPADRTEGVAIDVVVRVTAAMNRGPGTFADRGGPDESTHEDPTMTDIETVVAGREGAM